MVGGLVQDQEIRFRKHQLCQGNPSPFASAEIADPLKGVVPRKKKGGQGIADLGVGHSRVSVGNLFKQRFFVMEDLVILVIVADMDLGA